MELFSDRLVTQHTLKKNVYFFVCVVGRRVQIFILVLENAAENSRKLKSEHMREEALCAWSNLA